MAEIVYRALSIAAVAGACAVTTAAFASAILLDGSQNDVLGNFSLNVATAGPGRRAEGPTCTRATPSAGFLKRSTRIGGVGRGLKVLVFPIPRAGLVY